MDKTTLGDRMKTYEASSKNFLVRRMPTIIRLDGKAFHTFTRTLDKPYDIDFKNIMMETAEFLVQNIMNCKLAYVQSDEISLLLVDYESIVTEAWFNNNVQKMVSVSASMATAKFNELFYKKFPADKREKIKQTFAMFDSRAFNIPREDVANYFIFRQQDAVRNSIQGLGQKYFTHKEMHGKNNNVVQDMLMVQKGINWNDVETYFKRGGCVYRGVKITSGTEYVRDLIVDWNIPIFTQDREYIECHVNPENSSMLSTYASTIIARANRDVASEILEGVPSNDVLIDTANAFMEDGE